ncbi:hypothetical protein J2P12_04080 [Candidatus Bathyarchaeota archaeon]|nr:hypothetical protein [Candidatus Bathyarchaeota archaeon]
MRASKTCVQGVFGFLLLIVSLSGSLTGTPFQNHGQVALLLSANLQPSVSSPITSYPIPTQNSNPQAIVLGPDNHTLWFTEIGAGKIGEFSIMTNNVTREIPVNESGAMPYTLAIGNRGLIWFTDANQISPSVWNLNVTGSTPVFHRILTNASPSDPIFVLVDNSTGYVWFTDYFGNYLGEITDPKSSAVSSKYPLPTANSGPVEIAKENGTSYLWISEASGRIVRFDTATRTFQEFLPTVSLSYPVGIVVDKDGNVWVSEHYGSSVTEFIPSSSIWRKYPTSQSSISPGTGVATLSIDARGRLWFAEHFSSRVGRLDPSTGEMVEFPLQTAGAYSLLNVIDGQGNFWFTESGSNEIGMIPGNVTSSLSVNPVGVPGGPLTAGSSATVEFNVTNTDRTNAVTIRLNVTSSFTTNFYTTKSEVGLSTYDLTLDPGKSAIVNLVATPDSSLSSGLYAVGLVANNNGVLTTNTFVLQVQENLLHRIESLLPIILVAAAALLASLLVFSRYRKKNTIGPRKPEGSVSRAVLAVGLASLISIQSVSLAWAKCPLPPPPGGNSGVDFYGIALDAGAVVFFAVVAYFLVRGWLRGRNPPESGGEAV